ncbi:hypothetical protein UZ36_01075 [Candidatus Nitromaritima sp. SCGC AAA799-C22]|nr:hypothetical protein UZ36_01075 [Candidatus Nitromaritima sp. SCGC AAA799-C22]
MQNRSVSSGKGLIISGTHSSAGKSSVSAGLMRLLSRRGYSVKPFKVGPDYIDPGHHLRACGEPSYNLDTFMSTPRYVRNLFEDRMTGDSVAVVEGVMGLFDGAYPTKPLGSTAEMAKLLNLPVILVIDPKAMARSAAALVSGFFNFDPKVRFLGVVANRINSEGHARLLKEAIRHHTKARFLGCLPTDPNLEIPSRHLGLFLGEEQRDALYDSWADHLERHLDMDFILKQFRLWTSGQKKTNTTHPIRWRTRPSQEKFTVAVAKDEAFQFIYPDTLDLFRHFGGEVRFFSPIRDRNLPDEIDWIYFPGGYPELYANKLSANKSLLKEVRNFGNAGKTIIGECGGMMYLGKNLTDEKGKIYGMAGLFGFSTTLKEKKMTLGYRQLSYQPNGTRGRNYVLKGHEFHYSSFSDNPEKPRMVQKLRGKGFGVRDGYRFKNCFALYSHIYWGSSPHWLNFILQQVKT